MRHPKVWLAVFVFLTALRVGAEPFSVGDRIEPFSLEDQHGVRHSVDESTAVILFSRDMDGGKLLKEAFAEDESDPLEGLGAAYVADISGMPKLVAKLFALPSMRRRPYSMLLDRDGTTTARLPDVEGRATLLFLDRLEIERIEHVGSVEAIRGILGIGPRELLE